MKTIMVIYWSGTGNTQAMAEAIGRGIEGEGIAASVLEVDSVSPGMLKEEMVYALGCPAMGDEVLEEGSMEPFITAIEESLEGKQLALFGAYGWGDGQWMRDWEKRMKEKGASIVNGKGLIACEEPDDQLLEDCEKLGKKLALL